nr:hypothetical protein [Tanacetum cinerariifolium]
MNDEEVKLHSEGYGAVYVKKTKGYVVCVEAGHNKTGIATLNAEKAIAKNTGVRGLRVILENVLMDSMFEVLYTSVLSSLRYFKKHSLEDGASFAMPFLHKQHDFCHLAARKIKESLNVTFADTSPPSKTSPLVDDDLDEEEAIKATKKQNLENMVEDETLEIDDIVNINESKNNPLENVIGDESWIVAMQEELNQFIANDV